MRITSSLHSSSLTSSSFVTTIAKDGILDPNFTTRTNYRVQNSEKFGTARTGATRDRSRRLRSGRASVGASGVAPTLCSGRASLGTFHPSASTLGRAVSVPGSRLGRASPVLGSRRAPFEPPLRAPLERANSIVGTPSNIVSYATLDVINKCFSRRTVEEIIAALEREAADKKDDWISSTIQSLKKASPTSLKISLKSIREGRLQGIGKCLVREFRMVCHVMLGEVSKDFVEGCRAILLDKDRNPKWEPSKLELISDEMVDPYFCKADDDGWEDLNLPVSSKLPAYAIAKL
ncbi:ATP-dependent caseinolytic protease/crotonase family protein [Perilla frutescens var. hirtella]|nr:ATP-dependent caseinolytic protease/crotonase family protein [Perilla frutescens var. hirtella]KAH6808387.1 ATP-dependent caseinolytic protease/crotonase family protein [Perilla frutescens var. frutescens]